VGDFADIYSPVFSAGLGFGGLASPLPGLMRSRLTRRWGAVDLLQAKGIPCSGQFTPALDRQRTSSAGKDYLRRIPPQSLFGAKGWGYPPRWEPQGNALRHLLRRDLLKSLGRHRILALV